MSLIKVDSLQCVRNEAENISLDPQRASSVRIDIPRVIFRDLQMQEMEYLLEFSLRVRDGGIVVELGGEDTRPAVIIGMGFKAQNKNQVRYHRYSGGSKRRTGRDQARMTDQPHGTIKDHLKRTEIEHIVAISRKESSEAIAEFEPESVDLLVISDMQTFEGYLRTLHDWQSIISPSGSILLYSGRLNESMLQAANRFAFQSGMGYRLSSPSLSAYFMELGGSKSYRTNRDMRWFAAPAWENRDSWMPLLETYIQFHSENKDCLLSLYAGDLTNSDTRQVFQIVSDYLERRNMKPENTPEIEIVNRLALEGEFYIPLCGGPLDTHLEKRYSLRCFDFSRFPLSA